MFEKSRGGATLLAAHSAVFGGTVWEKLLRYYGTKALRSNCRVSKPGLQLICQPEVPEARQHTRHWWSLPYVSEAHRKHLFSYSPITLFTSKKAAFTLAEVLITLGIIGIVAAMTIPTLVQNYKKKVVETKLVNFYSVMNNAVKMSEIENGQLALWDALEQDEIKDDANNVIATPTTNVLEWFNKYFVPYVQTARVEKLEKDRDGKLAVYFNDGSLVLIGGSSWFFYPESNDFRTFDYDDNYTDIDKSDCGIKFFTFYFNPATNNDDSYKFHKNKGVEPYMGFWDGTLDDLKNNSRTGCRENVTSERAFCTKLIQLNNWKIPDDYPVKF